MKYVKYRTQKQQVSYDGGETWEDTGEIRNGEYLGVYDTEEDCANATVPHYVVPQAHQNAKATLLLDDGTEVDLPFTGHISIDADSAVDDYAFTQYDLDMTYAGSSIKDNRDYIAEHCIRIVVSDQVEYVCYKLTGDDEPYGVLTFEGYGSVGYDMYGVFRNLSEIVLPNSVKYIKMDGHHTQVSKLILPQTFDCINLKDFVYIDKEFTIPESFEAEDFGRYSDPCSINTVDKIISYTNFQPYWPHWRNYGCVPNTLLLYNESIRNNSVTMTEPGSNMAVPYVRVPKYTYVRDELVSAWQTALINGCYIMNEARSTTTFPDVQRITENPFFPLSIYNADFRNPNDNEKFVARLSDGTLYSIPIGNGVVTSGDVEGIHSTICDIKFGPGVVKINNGVFKSGDTFNASHNINLVEFNSDVDLSECGTYVNIDKVKLNGNNYFNSFTTALMTNSSTTPLYSVPRYIFVPDVAFENYVKTLPLKYARSGQTAESSRTDDWRLKFRPMSLFKIND